MSYTLRDLITKNSSSFKTAIPTIAIAIKAKSVKAAETAKTKAAIKDNTNSRLLSWELKIDTK